MDRAWFAQVQVAPRVKEIVSTHQVKPRAAGDEVDCLAIEPARGDGRQVFLRSSGLGTGSLRSDGASQVGGAADQPLVHRLDEPPLACRRAWLEMIERPSGRQAEAAVADQLVHDRADLLPQPGLRLLGSLFIQRVQQRAGQAAVALLGQS